ncbi:helix-turn-helix domain-containing protein [Pelotomaculum sp. FP]|uniref:LexA family protein n=1 Tax=Pelotomaculum sp. FP TaxID=261474 RepID=UPI001064A904|nr:helix-turn-helix domain-containing protein [Pelotomaculum sp. FP]
MAGPRFDYNRLSNHALLDAIKKYTSEHGYSPTIRELAKMTGTGASTVHAHLNGLLSSGGYLRIEQPRCRVLRVVKDYD